MGIFDGKEKKEPQIVRLDLAMNTIKTVTKELKTKLYTEGKRKQSEALGLLDVVVFKVELKKFIENTKQLTNFGIFYKSENKSYYKTKWIEKINDEYRYNKEELIEVFSPICESGEIILYTRRETKEKFFKKEKELSEADMKQIYTVWNWGKSNF